MNHNDNMVKALRIIILVIIIIILIVDFELNFAAYQVGRKKNNSTLTPGDGCLNS